MKKFQTEQEEFWAGKFGEEYILRNQGEKAIASNISLFSRILERTLPIQSAIELGANIGLNLLALKNLLPECQLEAIEINKKAVNKLQEIKDLTIYAQSILEFMPQKQYDLSFIKGVLIHINPDKLNDVYDLLYQCSKKYICIVEYYNPVPVEVEYRGNRNKLFKRDFAGEILDRYSDLILRDYGFVYHRDNNFSQDDLTWFLLEK